MVPQIHYVFGKNINEAGVLPNVYHNTTADVLSLEVSGEFSGVIKVEGRVDKENENYTAIAGVDMGEFLVAKTITKTGIYEYGVEGIQDVRINIESISGNINIFGRFVNTAA